MKKKVASLLLSAAMMASILAGCGDTESAPAGGDTTPAATQTDNGSADTGSASADTATPGEVTDFTMFITMPGSEINDDNEIAQMIADKYRRRRVS